MKIDFRNSPKMKNWLFETKIWYAWLGLHKDVMIIMFTKMYQFYCTLYKKM